MKLLIVTDNLFANSSYSHQVLLIGKALQEAGHEIVVFGTTYTGQPVMKEGLLMLGNYGRSTWGSDELPLMLERIKPDAFLTFKDPFVYDGSKMARLDTPWIALCPIDTEPLSQAVAGNLAYTTFNIAVTRNGQHLMANEGFSSFYCPLMVDETIYHPGDKLQARKLLDLPEDAFIALAVGNNNSNPSRKSFDRILLAWYDFIQDHPDAILYLHTDMTAGRGGLNLEMFAHQFQLTERNLRYSDQHQYNLDAFPSSFVAALYQAADVLLQPSMGEGFCLPAVEAQACGTPVISTAFTALRETAGGWYLEADITKPEYGELVLFEFGAYRFAPSVPAIHKYINHAYVHHNDPDVKAKALDCASRYWSSDILQHYWLPTIAKIEAMIKEGKLE